MPKQPFPGKVSAVVAQERVKRHLGARVNVFIEGRFSFALSLDLAYKHGLKPGMGIDAAQLEALLREDGEARALTTALNFIGYRPRARAEIRTRLERDEWSETVIERVIERLAEAKLLDDAQFAVNWVESRSRSKPRGARALKQELRLKGIDKEEIEAALPDDEGEIANAVAALEKLGRKLAAYEGRDRERKAIEMMARRGFSYSATKEALKRLEEE